MASIDPPPNARPRSAKPLIGDVNICEACIGLRGSGKSTYQANRARELQIDWNGAYVIGHSMGARLPKSLPESLAGRETPLKVNYYMTIAELDRGLRRKPGEWHILAVPLQDEAPTLRVRETADDLIHYAIRLSTSLRRQAWERAHFFGQWKPNVDMRGLPCTPIIIFIDEGIAIKSAATGDRGKGKEAEWFLEFLFSLRHLHIALLYNIQEPTSRSWRVVQQATRVHVFRQRHQFALNMIQASGATDQQMYEITALRKYERVTLDPETDLPNRKAVADRLARDPTWRERTAPDTKERADEDPE